MRILLDECVPAKLGRELTEHEVRTVPRMRWSGIKDGELLRRTAREFDVFITVDRSIRYQQTPPPDLAILTLHVPDNSTEAVVSLAPDILRALVTIQPGDSVHVGAWP